MCRRPRPSALPRAQFTHPVGRCAGLLAKPPRESPHRCGSKRLLFSEHDHANFPLSGSFPGEPLSLPEAEVLPHVGWDGHLATIRYDGHIRRTRSRSHICMLSCGFIMCRDSLGRSVRFRACKVTNAGASPPGEGTRSRENCLQQKPTSREAPAGPRCRAEDGLDLLEEGEEFREILDRLSRPYQALIRARIVQRTSGVRLAFCQPTVNASRYHATDPPTPKAD